MRHSLVCIGGGYVGLAFALSVKKALGTDFSVTLIDPSLSQNLTDKRAFLMSASAIRFLKSLEVWEKLPSHPVLKMVITDSKLSDKYRAALLTFEGEVVEGEPFGAMVEQGRLMEALINEATTAGVTLLKDSFVSMERHEHYVEITLLSGSVLKTALIIGADGAKSKVREQANIQMVGSDYEQVGIVCTLSHEEDNKNTAFEHFLPAGPFATLPLSANTSSVVWTEEKSRATKILNQPRFVFQEELATRLGTQLGEVKVLDTPKAFPLSVKMVRSFVSERVALIGDSAHTIHPIAGQGVNLGLKDAISLADTLIETARLGLDIGSLVCLERYQMARRPQTLAMAAATDSLNRLFSNENDALKIIRDTGLSVVDRITPLKNRFIKEAAGV